jgi:hypothetical protein
VEEADDMGSWGTALYSDDLSSDLRGDFRDLIGEGLAAEAALDRLMQEYAASFADADEAPVCWLAIAETAWRLGRPIARATGEALRVIESGADLLRWSDPRDRRRRAAVLEEVAETLRSSAPPPKRVPRRFRANNPWAVGEIIAYRLGSGNWTAFRVIGHHVDKGGRSAVCEPLAWTGSEPPRETQLRSVGLRPSVGGWKVTQFLLGEPRRRTDADRLVRTGILSNPLQAADRYFVFVFPHVDRELREMFGLE